MIGMGAKSITIVRAVTADFFFNCRAAEILSMSELGTYHGASTIMRKTLDWIKIYFDSFRYILYYALHIRIRMSITSTHRAHICSLEYKTMCSFVTCYVTYIHRKC
jgi:hypothetical protein